MQRETNVSARLARLEAQNRRLQGAVALLGLALFGLFAAGFAAPSRPANKELRAERFVLVDAAGAELGVLGADSQGSPNLLLRKDKASAILTLSGPALALRGDDGKKGAWLGMDTKGGVGLSLSGEKVLDGVRALVKADGSSGAYLLGPDGRERIGLELLQDGTAALSARDESGVPRVFAGLTGETLPGVLLLDANGKKRAGLLLQPGDLPLFSLDDERGQSRLELNQRFDGQTFLRTFGETGQASFEAP